MNVCVRIFAGDKTADRLVAEFIVTDDAQYADVPKICRVIHFWASDQLNATIDFPKTEAERMRARRKAQRRLV